jgi:hypothetical protein
VGDGCERRTVRTKRLPRNYTPLTSVACRYVAELVSIRELYIDPLIHPHRSPPPSNPNSPSIPSCFQNNQLAESSGGESDLHLPIAARFLNERGTVSASGSSESTPKTDQGSWTHGEGNTSTQQLPEIIGETNTPRLDTHPSFFNNIQNATNPRLRSQNSIPATSRSSAPTPAAGVSRSEPEHPPPPPSSDSRRPSQSEPQPNFRHYLKSLAGPPPKKLHRPRSNVPLTSLLPTPLPEALRTVLEVIGSDMLKGHEALSVRLKERYQDQYPLVRSLTDVWADQVMSPILK